MVSPRGKLGMGRRQCTSEYKLKPIRRKMRELSGLAKGARCKEIVVTQWIGISRDEIMRMKPSRDAWCLNRFPLVDLGVTREDCLRWMRDRQYPRPPRSACTFCPYHSNAEWRDLRDSQPEAWQEDRATYRPRDSAHHRGNDHRRSGPVFSVSRRADRRRSA